MQDEKRLTVRLRGKAPKQLDEIHAHYKDEMPSMFNQNDAINLTIQNHHKDLGLGKKRGKKNVRSNSAKNR